MTRPAALPSLMPTLIPWTFTSILLILAVLVVRKLTQNRLSPVNRYALWLVVLIRLLVPIQLPFLSSLGAVDFAPQMENTPVYAFPTSHMDAPESYIQHIWKEQGEDPVMSAGVASRSFPALGGIGFDYYNGGTILDENGYTDYAFFSTVPRILSILWGAGAVVMLLCLAGNNLRFAARLRRSRRPLDIPECPLPVYLMEGLSSPCLSGLFHPAIYLTPEVAANETALRHVLAHEATHYAHKDHIWSALRCTALALHWYNPLVWLAVSLSKADGELACDEGAVRRLGEEERIPYGRTLVDTVACRSQRPADLLSCSTTMAGGNKTIQQRVALLVKKPETKAAAILGACTALALAAVFTFGGGVSSPYNPDTLYDQFCSQVQQASTIQVTPPSRFSVSYPEPITAPFLLEAARADLLCARAPTPQEARCRWNEDDISRDAYQIALTLSSGQTAPYLLYQPGGLSWKSGGENLVYVLSGSPLRTAGVLDTYAVQALVGWAEQQNEHQRSPVPLTPEELAYFNDGSFFSTEDTENPYTRFSIRNMFLTSRYDTPQDIDLFELFYCGSTQPSAPMSQKERQLVIDRGYHGTAPPCGCTKITRQEMDAVLLEHTGLTLEETHQVGLEQFTYLPEYDAYYHFHGDTNYTFPIFSQGFRQGDMIYLDYGDCRLTLRQTGNSYQFCSNHSLNTLPAKDDALARDLSSDAYLQAEARLLPLLLSDPEWEMAVKTLDYSPDTWHSWLLQCMEAAELSPHYDANQETWSFRIKVSDYYSKELVDLPSWCLQPDTFFLRSASPTRVSVSPPSHEPQVVADAFGEALARFYLQLDSRHPMAVSSAQLTEAEVCAQRENTLCARITLTLEPTAPNTIYWMAGAGLDLDGEGLWVLTREYRLERWFDGSWHCIEAASGGLSPL